jgi:Ricin-type beta-trefoil lectin domain
LPTGALKSSGECLNAAGGKILMQPCDSNPAERWLYTLAGNLVNRSDHLCLTGSPSGDLTAQTCGLNLATQIWSLPNPRIHERR